MGFVQEHYRELARIYEDVRKHGRGSSIRSLIAAAGEAGLPLDLEELRVFAERTGERRYAVCPDWIVSFLALAGKEYPHASLLDPQAGLGSVAAPLARKLQAPRAVAICGEPEECRLAPLLNPGAGVEWVASDPVRYLEATDEQFDLIATCFAPHDPAAGDVLGAVASRMREEGAAFVMFEEDAGIRAIADRFGRVHLHVDSLLAVPGGLLIIARTTPADRLLVGELGPDQSSQDILAKNIQLRRAGKAPELGVLLDAPADRGVREVILHRAIEERGRDGGFAMVPLRAIAREMRIFAPDTGFPPRDNAVYLPRTAAHPVVRSVAGAEAPDVYVQVVLDPAVSAAYVARFFETALGSDLLRLYAMAAARQGVLEALADAPFPLPPADVQEAVLEVAASLQEARTRLDALERELWTHPFAAEPIGKEIAGWVGEDDFERWMESLPFPIASILWAYRAETSDDRCVDHLFNFFEALGEFVALLMLSALGPLCVERGVDLLEDNPYFRDSYRYATFRAWNVLGRRLAHHTRSLLSRTTTRDLCLAQFGNPDPAFLDMITSKRLFAVLDEAADLRNLWKGHGGTVGPGEEARRRKALEECLQRGRGIIGDRFEAVQLIAPETSSYHEGIFSYDAQSLTGSRMTFRRVKVATVVPMDARKLYLLSKGQKKPVEILPLLRIMEVPEVPARACYFYNRIEGDQVRWVSYHFAGEAEVLRPDGDVIEVLSSFGLIEKER
ncbi:MAG TPA: hypothetical protein ENN85_07680 [Methanoculleus sp.]|nr:hypothetical protein [Methanoculleus sp.]